ncbi:hypothetical protein JCM19301_3961 [Jejuia pallidilutea]|uniref:Uncharacterized protein n=1 Tax=Jejuia pallidilutea TaxID=504487 RepID=A0A090VLC9_9FLAO|nr:hypothetical protein JCM19301_3961 [Jejuia pallidilutea]GAL70062.1 hypothetical protein JCM19302_2637 [Jejuia pallidilutea]
MKTFTFALGLKFKFNLNEIPTFVGMMEWQEYLQAYKAQEHRIWGIF